MLMSIYGKQFEKRYNKGLEDACEMGSKPRDICSFSRTKPSICIHLLLRILKDKF